MGERVTTSIEEQLEAFQQIGDKIGFVSADITDHLLAEHKVSPDDTDYPELFASHLVAKSLEFRKPELVIVYDSAARNRRPARAERARFGGKRWARDVTG